MDISLKSACHQLNYGIPEGILIVGQSAFQSCGDPAVRPLQPSLIPENSCVLRRTGSTRDRSDPSGVCFAVTGDIDRPAKLTAAGCVFRCGGIRIDHLAFFIWVVTIHASQFPLV